MTPDEWKAVLNKIAPRGKPWIIDGFADALPQLVEKYHIDTPLRQAHFLAQVAHESDHFRTTTNTPAARPTRAAAISATRTRATASATRGAA